MAGINKVILIGRTGKDPEIKSVGDHKLAKFSLAVSESYKDKQGNKIEETEWFNIEVWGPVAGVVEQYVNKGDLLYIEGKFKTDEYEKDGVKMKATKVRATSLTMLGSKQEGGQNQSQGNSSNNAMKPPQGMRYEDDPDDDLPF